MIFQLEHLISVSTTSVYVKMEIPFQVILDSTNYFQWVSYMEELLRSKGLYRIVPGQESKPKDEDKQAKWENKQDQAVGLIGMSISLDLRFHIVELDTPNEAMKQLNKVFGTKNQIRAHQLENKFLTLDPNNFSSIKDFFSISRPLDLSWKVLRLIKKMVALYIPFLLIWDQPTLCLFPPSILLEKPLFLKEKTTSPPLLVPFVIL